MMYYRALQKLKAPFSWLKKRSSGTGDTEPEQAIIRIAFGVILTIVFGEPWLGYDHFLNSLFYSLDNPMTEVTSLLFLSGLIIYTWLIARPVKSPVRRLVGAVADITLMGLVMVFGHSEGIFLFAFYLWIILGNGFRYGLPYLFFAQVYSIITFSAAVLISPFWQNEMTHYVAISFIMVLIVVPGYTSFLVKKLHGAILLSTQASEAKTRFLASMSHELRTPLHGVIGLNAVLQRTQLDTEQRDIARNINRSAKVLLSLIEKVLDISKIETGKVQIKKSEVSLEELIDAIFQSQKVIADSKRLRLTYDIDLDAPLRIIADEKAISQVLVNLVGNAIKYTDSGSVHIQVSRKSESKNKAFLRFDVIDTGIGIAEEMQAKVFDDFTRVGILDQNKVSGAGLGTSIARELVTIMGGTIGVESKLGSGSTFWFDLPVDVIEGYDDPKAFSPIVVVSLPERSRFLRMGFDNLGFENVTISSGELLIEVIQTFDNPKQVNLMIDYAALPEDALAENLSLIIDKGLASEVNSIVIYNLEKDKLTSDLIEAAKQKHGLLAVHEFKSQRAIINAILKSRTRIAAIHFLPPEAGTISPKNILVAEDNETNQQVIFGLLSKDGHNVTVVDNGDEALRILSKEYKNIDLVILDKNMPGISGDMAAKIIKQNPLYLNVPVMMLTADATSQSYREGYEVGVDAFLTKPLDDNELMRQIAHLTEGRLRRTDMRLSATPKSIASKDIKAPNISNVTPISSNKKYSSLIDEEKVEQLSKLGDGQFLTRLTESFRRDGYKYLSEIQDEVDIDVVNESLHALKGVSAMVGGKAMFIACEHAEGELRRNNVSVPIDTDLLTETFENTLTYFIRRQTNAKIADVLNN